MRGPAITMINIECAVVNISERWNFVKPGAALAMGVLVLTMTSGCGASDRADGWNRPVVPGELPIFSAASVLPLDHYHLGSTEREQLQIATAKMLSDCLRDYGLSATFAGDYIQQRSEDPSTPIAFQSGEHLGTLSEKQASEYGYTAPPGRPWQNGTGFYLSSPANLYAVPPADPLEAARISGALYGPDQAVVPGEGGGTKLSAEQLPRDREGNVPRVGGCVRAVESAIDVPFVDTSEIELDVYGLAFADSRVEEVFTRWSDCMRTAGHDYPRVDDAANSNAGIATPESIAVAIDDVACTQKSRWPDTFYFVLSEYQRQAIDKNAELFQSAFDAEQQRLDALSRLSG